MSSNVAIANRHFHSVQGFSSQPRSITVPEGEKTINDNSHSKKGIIDNISNDHILNHTDELDSDPGGSKHPCFFRWVEARVPALP